MILTRTQAALMSATFLASAIAAPGVAFAQATSATATSPAPEASEQPSGEIQDIVVTAQKRSEKLQDVPIAVTAISGETLASRGISSALEIAAVTPGLTFTTAIGTTSPRLRGVGTASALGGNENAVATYVDGVYYASSASSLLSLSNIAQVAVLKGPQGTLFGRNATGGLIQITTLDPKQDFGGKLSATYGSQNTIGGSLYVTGGLSDGIAADVSVYYNDQRDGFGRNIFTGNDVYKSEDLAVRSKIVANVGELTRIKISGDYSTIHAAIPGRRSTYGTKPTLGLPFTAGPFDVDSNIDGRFDSKRGGGSVELVHEFGGFNLVTLTAYREAKTAVAFDTDGTRIDNSSAANVFKERQFSQEIQLISSGGGPFSWTVGGYYFAAKGGYDSVILRRPTATSRGLVGLEALFRTYQQTKAPAVYGQGTYKITPTTSVTVGLRYSSESRNFSGNGTNRIIATNVVTVPAPVAGKISADRVTWRLAVDQRLSEDVLVYASYNRGFKSGGFNGALFETSQPFNPETLDAYEIGLKSDLFDRRVRINGSAFYYKYKDIQLTNYGQVGVPVFSNASDATIYGYDIDATVKPIDNLTLTLGFSYLHSKLGKFNTSQVSKPLAAGGNSIVQGDSTGNDLPNTPEYTINLGADYDIPLGKGGVIVSGNYFHSDGWFAETDNRLRQPAYDLFNASMQFYLTEDRRVTLTAWGKNLTNEVVATQLQARATGDVVSVAPGRTYGATVGFKF
jgi:iron complex outermembrane recepter protein